MTVIIKMSSVSLKGIDIFTKICVSVCTDEVVFPSLNPPPTEVICLTQSLLETLLNFFFFENNFIKLLEARHINLK